MYVCICNGVTDRIIREAAENGVRTLPELQRRTGCAGNCGSCADLAAEVLHEALSRHAFALPVLAAA
jgi:bacterioferritin-associated ferredoxin